MAASFKILLKKNLKTEIRSWNLTVFEIVAIFIIFIIIVINPTATSIQDDDSNHKDDTKSVNFRDDSPLIDELKLSRATNKFHLVYTPPEQLAKEIVEAVTKQLSLSTPVAIANASIMEDQFDKRNTLAAVIFPTLKADEKLTTKLSLIIRFPSEFRTIHPTETSKKLWVTRCCGLLAAEELDEVENINELYLREGFLQLQHQLFLEWYKKIDQVENSTVSDANMTLMSFIHETDAHVCNTIGTSNLSSFLHYFTFLLPFCNLIWRYAREREENMLVHHWKFGYSYGAYWCSHFVVSSVHFFVLNMLILLMVKIHWTSDPSSGILYDIDPLVLLIFLLLYQSALILYAIVIVCLIVDAKNSVLFGIIMWLATYALFSVVLENSTGLRAPLVLFSFILFFNNSFAYGMHCMKNIEDLGDKNEIWILISVMLIGIIVHVLLLMLIQHYRPGRYMARKAVDCFNIRKRCRQRKFEQQKGKGKLKKTVTLTEPSPSWHNFEFGPVVGDEFVRLKNLCTYYKSQKRKQHLKNINMRIFKGEITVILGHHSSGKTSLINCMSGWSKPPVGLVYYEGQDIYENWAEVRRDVDICMPNNTLFDCLTPQETLEYFVRLKTKAEDVQRLKLEVNKWMDVLRPVMGSKVNLVRSLTFEQKRLLCLCCALACNTKIILLDEPTLHMRVNEQHLYWAILQKEKPDRAIVLTTFSIDEAELGDRIGILVDGVLRAYGTPFFLTTKFGVGYDLIILKKPDAPTEPITELLRTFIPRIVPDNEIGNQLFYKVPNEKRPIYQQLLLHLEKEAPTLGIDSIRMLGSELSEIYMTLGKRKNNQIISKELTFPKIEFLPEKERRKQQICAMLYKKLLHQAPNIVPIIMIFVSFVLILLIGEMSKVLHVPPTRYWGINLGFNESVTTSRQLLKGMENCKFVEIGKVDMGNKLHIKINSKSRIFTNQSLVCRDKNFKEYIQKVKTIDHKIGAVEMTTGSFTCWYNQRIFHSAPLVLNLYHNLLLKLKFPNTEYTTTIVNHPLPIPLRTKINLLDHQLSHLRVPLTVGIIMPITISIFIINLVDERRNHLLLLQVMAGIRMSIYWTITMLWDLCTFFMYAIVFIIVMTITTIEGFGLIDKMWLLLLLLFYGAASLALTYFLSMVFYASVLRSFLISVVVQLLTGLCAYVFYWDVIDNNYIFFYFASLFPTFSLLDGISNIYTENKEQEYCANKCLYSTECNPDNMCQVLPQCCGTAFFKWEDPGIIPSLVFMSLSCLIFLMLMFFLQLYRKETLFSGPRNLKTKRSACYPYDDRDVVAVKKKIAEADYEEISKLRFVVDQLEDHISKKQQHLHTISFALNKNTSMGVFGARHSGKSHCIKQLIGEHGFAFGDVYVRSADVKHDLETAYDDMGYCPQTGGLFVLCTPRQMLSIFCMIRGIEDDQIKSIIRELSLSLDMSKYMNKQIGTLTPEKRRKVNIAVALLGHSKIVILDEPTLGLPAYSRREIWNVLRYARFIGKTLIFTSSGTLECEAMSDQIMLFDDGEMLAIGSTQYLRKKFTRGFYLEVKLKRDGNTAEEAELNLLKDIENLNRFITFLHAESELLTRIDSWFKFYLPVKNVTYSNLFGALEKNRRRLNIFDYTISQGTMDDVMRNIRASRLHRTETASYE